MSGRATLSARVLFVVTLVGTLGITPSHADNTIAQGTVILQKTSPNNADHETIQYFVNECEDDYPSGVFNAFIDVRAYAGKTLRFIPTSADPPVWRLIKGTECDYVVRGTATQTTAAIEWESTGEFLAISLAGIKTEPSSYVLKVCPCDP